MLCPKCSPSNIRRNETNAQHSFLVKWLIRLPGKQEVHGSIPCEGGISFFCSVLWLYHHVAISVIRTRETIMSELSPNTVLTSLGRSFCFRLPSCSTRVSSLTRYKLNRIPKPTECLQEQHFSPTGQVHDFNGTTS